MSPQVLLIVAGGFLLIGLFIALIVGSGRRRKERLVQAARSLGFTPIEPDAELIGKICNVFRQLRFNHHKSSDDPYKLQNVFRKQTRNGTMLIFDLLDTSGEDDSYTEQQAIAMVSPRLDLPPFMLFPKSDVDGVVSRFANRVMEWVVSRVADPVEFPASPEFTRRYLVSSPEPDATRQFLDRNKLRRLRELRLIRIHAGGDLFTFSHMQPGVQKATKETLRERVTQAERVYSILTA